MGPAHPLQCLKECRAIRSVRQEGDMSPVPMSEGRSGIPAPGQDLAVNVNGHRASAPTHLHRTPL